MNNGRKCAVSMDNMGIRGNIWEERANNGSP
jgi:hypothetical protein